MTTARETGFCLQKNSEEGKAGTQNKTLFNCFQVEAEMSTSILEYGMGGIQILHYRIV